MLRRTASANKRRGMEANWKELKKEFFDTGYVVLDGWIEPELVERTKQDAHQSGGIDIFECESIGDLLCHAKVFEFIAFLLETPEVAISPFPLLESPYARRAKRRRRLARG